ncbi:MAG: hypothetical protein QXI90_02480 [Thermofilum sp.]
MVEDKIRERVLLLRRYLPQLEDTFPNPLKARVYRDVMGLKYFEEPKSLEELAGIVTDEQLAEIIRLSPYRVYMSFRGKYYTVSDGELKLEGSWDSVKAAVRSALEQYGKKAYAVLKALLEVNEASFSFIAARSSELLGERVHPARLLAELRDRWELVWEAREGEKTWSIPEEIRPAVEEALNEYAPGGLPRLSTKQAEEEYAEVVRREEELRAYLSALLRERLDRVLEFGESFSPRSLVEYLVDLFGPVVFFDELLTLTQQYSLSDTGVVTESGHRALATGFNLALFGEPGTGKTFATKDFILGNEKLGVLPHGIPGVNRYCGGMTPAMFIAIGEAYVGRRFNFIVTEFNDWFKYKGMVEPLKLAMEGGVISYETKAYKVGPYKFDSFFSVNYNTRVYERGYDVTVNDPNFNAIEDRMLCRLHRLTREKYKELAESQKRLMLGITTRKMAEKAPLIRDHLTLVYAVQTRHPLARELKPKLVLLKEKDLELIEKTRDLIFEHIPPSKALPFSMRLERRALQLAAALSLTSYFRREDEVVEIDQDALRLAVRFYAEEAWIRARESFPLSEVLEKLSAPTFLKV